MSFRNIHLKSIPFLLIILAGYFVCASMFARSLKAVERQNHPGLSVDFVVDDSKLPDTPTNVSYIPHLPKDVLGNFRAPHRDRSGVGRRVNIEEPEKLFLQR